MKKIFISLLAVAALAACSKSEVAYEAPAEISFAPVAKNITKGAVGTVTGKGTYPTTQPLGVYANYGTDAPSANADVTKYTTKFLENKKFEYDETAHAWGADESWPANGSLIFAGYAIPASGTPSGTYTYNFTSDKLTITGYTQSNETANTFDLGWFNKTPASYNYRNSANTAVPVTLSHALAWVEIQVQGEGTTITATNPWTIKSMTLNNVYTKGNAECTGKGADKAKWNTLTDLKNMTIYEGSLPITGTATVCETTSAGTVVIPQTPTAITPDDNTDTEVATLTVVYTYKSPASTEENSISMPDQTATVSLALKDASGNSISGGWKSGYKYTYTLTFKASEILIAPDYDKWEDGGNQTVVVE